MGFEVLVSNKRAGKQMTIRQTTMDLMKAARAEAADFLSRHGMYYADLDPEDLLKVFLKTMEAERAAGIESGKMIPTFLGDYHSPTTPVSLTVIDIGGTNTRCTRLVVGERTGGWTRGRFLGPQKSGPRNRPLVHLPTPATDREMDTAGFFDMIAEGVKDFISSDPIGICFSFATVPQKDRDAVMIAGGKQIKISDMFGKKVGEEFRAALARKGLRNDQPITVINDAVAAALGGHLEDIDTEADYKESIDKETGCKEGIDKETVEHGPSQDHFSGYVGFIYGTGMNLCFREPTGELINTEAGTFCCFPAGDIDDLFDASLIDTGLDRTEKMMSGGYQGGLMSYIMRTAAREGLIDPRTVLLDPHDDLPSITSIDISAFSNDPCGRIIPNRIASACANEHDRAFLLALCDLVTERSALFCAATLTGVLLRAQIGLDPARPAFITAEGSTYLKQKGFSRKLSEHMAALAGVKYHLHYEFHVVDDVILKGTAVACLSSRLP